MLDDPLLLFYGCKYIYIGNNCNIFCCNNHKALFQYRPTLLGHVCAHTVMCTCVMTKIPCHDESNYDN